VLAIVISTILAKLGVAFWFRSSNSRARYRPDFTYSGRLEMLEASAIAHHPMDHDVTPGRRHCTLLEPSY
jgi:hypothetical protein